MAEVDQLQFLSEAQVRDLMRQHGSPLYIYSRTTLKRLAREVKSAFEQVPFGLSVRFAMKANPNSQIIQLFNAEGLHIDASSEYEVNAALKAGVGPNKILLTSQQLPSDLKTMMQTGIQFTATSLHQLEEFGRMFPGGEVSVRLNTGIGSGYAHRLTTGGIEVGFGIWYHKGDTRSREIHTVIERYNLRIKRVHMHIGTGSDPQLWSKVLQAGLDAAKDFETIDTLNLGGGFKIAYMRGDAKADLTAVGEIAAKMLQGFFDQTGRKLHFEVEPGRYVTAEAGSLLSTIIDRTDTGEHGDDFLKLNTGMTEFIRTAMYGAQHPLIVVPAKPRADAKTARYVVIGHCCESSDVFTTVPGNPEEIQPRELLEASIGDYMVIEKTGAYCASMSTKGYNSFPVAKEVFVD